MNTAGDHRGPPPDPEMEDDILAAWRENADAWVDAVRGRAIASREAVTNRAIVELVDALEPGSLLDLGCGEGWLCRALSRPERRIVGVDAIASLVESARAAGGAEYLLLDYDGIADGGLRERFDVVTCNFSLLGRRSVRRLLGRLPRLLKPSGRVVVQTVHPDTLSGRAPRADGWRTASWEGCGPGFGRPAPWYFRSLGSWRALFHESGLHLVDEQAPADPVSGDALSVIFVATDALAAG